MADKQFILVAYDISNDKRRTRLHKRLKDFGDPVQYSVFECLLEPEQVKRMKAAVRKIVRPKLDHVRFYLVCGACREKIEVLGRAEVTGEPQVMVV